MYMVRGHKKHWLTFVKAHFDYQCFLKAKFWIIISVLISLWTFLQLSHWNFSRIIDFRDKFNMSLKYTLALKSLTDESFVLGSARNIHPSWKLILGKKYAYFGCSLWTVRTLSNKANVSFISRQINDVFRCLQTDLKNDPHYCHFWVIGGISLAMKETRDLK